MRSALRISIRPVFSSSLSRASMWGQGQGQMLWVTGRCIKRYSFGSWSLYLIYNFSFRMRPSLGEMKGDLRLLVRFLTATGEKAGECLHIWFKCKLYTIILTYPPEGEHAYHTVIYWFPEHFLSTSPSTYFSTLYKSFAWEIVSHSSQIDAWPRQ